MIACKRSVVFTLIVLSMFILMPGFSSAWEKVENVRVERAAGIHLKVGTLPGHKKDREAIMVVATKSNQPLPPKLDDTPYYTADAIGSWLVDIPLSERTIKVLPYEIVSE